MLKNYSYEEKKVVVEGMVSGQSAEVAIAARSVAVSVRSAYRWLADYRELGEAGLQEKRQGVIWKFSDELREWLWDRCRNEPGVSARQLQAEMIGEFDVELSISHINQVRLKAGLSSRQLQKNKRSSTASP